MQPKTVSVIIPAFNAEQTLPACLTALQQQTYPPNEVIVVDDGSTDETQAVAHRFGVICLSQPNTGQAAARNLGARAALGELLLFTDADCTPTPDWVEQMQRPFADPNIAGAKGIYRTNQPELVARFVQQEYQDRYDRMAQQPQIDFIDTYAAAYRRDLFLSIGGFDPTFRINEDQEFSFRLSAHGYRLVYVPQAVVYHQHKRSINSYARRKYQIGFWKAFITQRHPDKLKSDSHTPQVLKLQMGLAGLGGGLFALGTVLRQRTITLLAWVSWLLLLLSGMSFYAKILRRDAPVLVVAPLMLFVRAWALGCGFLWGNLKLIRIQKQAALLNHHPVIGSKSNQPTELELPWRQSQ